MFICIRQCLSVAVRTCLVPLQFPSLWTLRPLWFNPARQGTARPHSVVQFRSRPSPPNPVQFFSSSPLLPFFSSSLWTPCSEP